MMYEGALNEHVACYSTHDTKCRLMAIVKLITDVCNRGGKEDAVTVLCLYYLGSFLSRVSAILI